MQVLLSLVSGVSTTLFKRDALSQTGNRGKLFKEVLQKHYPWDQEIDAPGRRSGAEAAADLYDLFRNPLAHTLGVVHTDTNRDGRRLMVAKAPLQEAELYDLEMTGSRPERWLEVIHRCGARAWRGLGVRANVCRTAKHAETERATVRFGG